MAFLTSYISLPELEIHYIIVVLVLYIVLNEYGKPYSNSNGVNTRRGDSLQQLDTLSLLVCLFTAWSGLFFVLYPYCTAEGNLPCYMLMWLVFSVNIGFLVYCALLFRKKVYNAVAQHCCKKERNHQYADISCYSFYPSKNLGAYGDGGIVTTNNVSLCKKIYILRNLGSIKKNVHDVEGLNSRLDTIQATILLKKIKYLNEHNDYRRKISKFYDDNLSLINEIKITQSNPGSARHLYVIRVKNRDKLAKFLLKNKIPIQFHYPYSLNKTGALRNKIKKIKLINSERWAKECLSLPLYPYMPINEAKRVVNFIKKFYK